MVHEVKETLIGMLFSPHMPHLLQKPEDVWRMMRDAEGYYFAVVTEWRRKK